MKTHTMANPSWSTASFGDDAHTSPMELSALGEHLSECWRASGPLFSLRCSAEAVHRFVAARFVTTLALAAAVLIGLVLFAS